MFEVPNVLDSSDNILTIFCKDWKWFVVVSWNDVIEKLTICYLHSIFVSIFVTFCCTVLSATYTFQRKTTQLDDDFANFITDKALGALSRNHGEIELLWNIFEIISVFCFTCNHVWNWNKIISGADNISTLFQQHWTCWKLFVSCNKLLR